MGSRERLPRLLVKYWWQLVLALGVPLVAAVAAEAFYGYRAHLEQIKRTQSVEASAFATAVDASLQRELRYVSQLYRVEWPRERLHRLAEELEIAISLFPSILQVAVGEDGREKVFVSQLEARRVGEDSPPEATVEPRVPQARFAAGRMGARELPVINVSIPSGRRPREELVMSLDLRTISDLLQGSAAREASTVYVLGGDGIVLAHSEPAMAISAADMGALAHVRTARQREAEAKLGISLESRNLSNHDVLATVRSVPGTDWLVVVEKPLSEVFAPIRAEVSRTLLLLALGLAGALVVGAGLAHRLTRPILVLGRDVERIGRGDLAHRTGIRTGDEIQQLGGQVNDMAARLQDYTIGLERKVEEQTSELQVALDVAREAMRARALFLAAASHDLRQPLYAISILADTLALEALSPAAADALAKQREAIAILRGLFDNLLDLSRFDSGEVRAAPRTVPLREVLGPIATEHEVVSRSKGLRWTCAIADVVVRTDPELLRRVVTNLLSNAVRYTREGEVSLAVDARHDRATIVVSDTGVGIPVEEQGRIFDEFVQLENPSRERDRGVGLGLSIVKKIDALLGLNLSLRSVPGVGTRVSIDVPIAQAVSAAPQVIPRDQPTHIDLAGMRVWIVEDDELVRDAYGRQFTPLGIDYAFAASRREVEALYAADGEWPDALILDDMLGRGERGLEIAHWAGGHIGKERIALITGNVDPAAMQPLADSGFTLLRKPAASAALSQWLQGAALAARASQAGVRAG